MCLWLLLHFMASHALGAPTLTTFPESAKNSGWDVVASQLKDEVNHAKNKKKLAKQLEALKLHNLTMPVSFFAGSELTFESSTSATGCTWNETVKCQFKTTLATPQELKAGSYKAMCRTEYTTSPIESSWTKESDRVLVWTVSHVEACWALNGNAIVIGPVGEQGLNGIGKGDDFNPPELVELSWRETEEILRSKVPTFRYCHQKLPKDHPGKSGRLEIRYHIDEEGRIDKAEIERATFEDSTLTDCVLERFRRIHIRPPMGGWTGGTFTLSFGK